MSSGGGGATSKRKRKQLSSPGTIRCNRIRESSNAASALNAKLSAHNAVIREIAAKRAEISRFVIKAQEESKTLDSLVEESKRTQKDAKLAFDKHKPCIIMACQAVYKKRACVLEEFRQELGGDSLTDAVRFRELYECASCASAYVSTIMVRPSTTRLTPGSTLDLFCNMQFFYCKNNHPICYNCVFKELMCGEVAGSVYFSCKVCGECTQMAIPRVDSEKAKTALCVDNFTTRMQVFL